MARHIPQTIHVSKIIAGIGRGLNEKIVDQFSARVGQPHEDEADRNTKSDLPDSFYDTAKRIKSKSDGYIEYVTSTS